MSDISLPPPPGDRRERCICARLALGHDCVGGERLRTFIAAVRTMRAHQRDWFGGDKSREKLSQARKAEREVDRLLAEIDGAAPKQGGLF